MPPLALDDADLEDAFLAAAPRFRGPPVVAVLRAGVAPATLEAVGGLGIARGEFAGGRFMFADDGAPAFLIAVRPSPVHRPIDLVAFDRTRFASVVGRVPFLGDPIVEEGPVRVHRHPRSWLVAGLDGVVVLDWHVARIELRRAHVEAEDQAHAREVARRMTPEPFAGRISLRPAASPCRILTPNRRPVTGHHEDAA
jgi:hypothetical protein